MACNKVTLAPLNFRQELGEAGLGLQRADLFGFHRANMVRLVRPVNPGGGQDQARIA
jgi:hypothetical protein